MDAAPSPPPATPPPATGSYGEAHYPFGGEGERARLRGPPLAEAFRRTYRDHLSNAVIEGSITVYPLYVGAVSSRHALHTLAQPLLLHFPQDGTADGPFTVRMALAGDHDVRPLTVPEEVHAAALDGAVIGVHGRGVLASIPMPGSVPPAVHLVAMGLKNSPRDRHLASALATTVAVVRRIWAGANTPVKVVAETEQTAGHPYSATVLVGDGEAQLHFAADVAQLQGLGYRLALWRAMSSSFERVGSGDNESSLRIWVNNEVSPKHAAVFLPGVRSDPAAWRGGSWLAVATPADYNPRLDTPDGSSAALVTVGLGLIATALAAAVSAAATEGRKGRARRHIKRRGTSAISRR